MTVTTRWSGSRSLFRCCSPTSSPDSAPTGSDCGRSTPVFASGSFAHTTDSCLERRRVCSVWCACPKRLPVSTSATACAPHWSRVRLSGSGTGSTTSTPSSRDSSASTHGWVPRAGRPRWWRPIMRRCISASSARVMAFVCNSSTRCRPPTTPLCMSRSLRVAVWRPLFFPCSLTSSGRMRR